MAKRPFSVIVLIVCLVCLAAASLLGWHWTASASDDHARSLASAEAAAREISRITTPTKDNDPTVYGEVESPSSPNGGVIASIDPPSTRYHHARSAARSAAVAAEAPRPGITTLTADAERQLHVMKADYKIPPKLQYGRSVEVAFVVETGADGTAGQLLAAVGGTATPVEVLVSNSVRATLTGPPDRVDIKPRGSEAAQQQMVTALAPLVWFWDVKGLDVGTVDLQLQLYSDITLNGTTTAVPFRTYQTTVPVEITPVDQVKRFIAAYTPVWTAATAVVTGVGGVLTFFGLRGPKAAKPA